MESRLKPCPLCGGHASVLMIQVGRPRFDATIVCDVCGLMLDWRTEYISYGTKDGSRAYCKDGLDPIEAWNRRVKE